MATIKATKVTNEKYLPVATPSSSRELFTVMDHVVVPDTLAADDLILLAVLPGNCLPEDILLYSSDLDTGTPAIVITVGVLNAAGTDLVPYSTMILSSTVGQAGGFAEVNSNLFMIPATWLAETTCPGLQTKKYIAAHVDTVAATPAAGTMDVRFRYRAAEDGI